MYLEIDEGYFEHPKTLRLCGALKDHHAAIYPIRLWKWACRSAKDGRLGVVDAFVIEKVVGYEAMDGRCFDALCAGFLDVGTGGEVRIHDWMVYTGAAVRRMEDSAASKKLWRAHKSGKCGRSCEWCKTVQVPSEDSPQTVHRRSMDAEQDKPTQSSPATSSHATPRDPDLISQSQVLEASDPDPDRAHVERLAHRNPIGLDLLTWFGNLRREILGLQTPPGTETPKDTNGKASTFASGLTDAEIADVKPTMRLALERIRDGVIGWNDPRTVDPSFAFGAWKNGFAGLREAIHGVAPKAKAQTTGQRESIFDEHWRVKEHA